MAKDEIKLFKEYELTYSQGVISLEKTNEYIKGDLGIQISPDGKVWICIDGAAFLRFTPNRRHF